MVCGGDAWRGYGRERIVVGGGWVLCVIVFSVCLGEGGGGVGRGVGGGGGWWGRGVGGGGVWGGGGGGGGGVGGVWYLCSVHYAVRHSRFTF